MQNFTEIFPTKCLDHLSSTRQAAGFINNASVLTNRFRQLVFRRSGVDLFSHQLALLCQFLDVDITSNCVLKTRGAKTVSGLLPLTLECFLLELSHGAWPSPFSAFPFKCTLRKTYLQSLHLKPFPQGGSSHSLWAGPCRPLALLCFRRSQRH